MNRYEMTNSKDAPEFDFDLFAEDTKLEVQEEELTDEEIVALEKKNIEAQSRIQAKLTAVRGDLIFDIDQMRDGLLRDTVLTILPYSQASAENILYTCMTIFGNIVGYRPYNGIGNSNLRANLFTLVVGETALAGKTQGLDLVMGLFTEIDPEYARKCYQDGIVTGAALLQLMDDGGIGDIAQHDRRLLSWEDEWQKNLHRFRSKENSLSQDYQKLKDKGAASKKIQGDDKYKVTKAHISMIGNITPKALLAENGRLVQPLINEGFMNRMLHVSTLMRTGSTDLPVLNWKSDEFQELIARWRKAIANATDIGQITLSSNAQLLQNEWDNVETEIALDSIDSKENPNIRMLNGRRGYLAKQLQIILALLDGSNKILAKHIRVSKVLMEYHHKSIIEIYGNAWSSTSSLTNTERIQEQFLNSPDGRLTKTQLHNSHTKNKHMTSEELTKSLEELVDKKFIVFDPETRMRNEVSGGNKRTEAYILLEELEAKEKEEDGI